MSDSSQNTSPYIYELPEVLDQAFTMNFVNSIKMELDKKLNITIKASNPKKITTAFLQALIAIKIHVAQYEGKFEIERPSENLLVAVDILGLKKDLL